MYATFTIKSNTQCKQSFSLRTTLFIIFYYLKLLFPLDYSDDDDDYCEIVVNYYMILLILLTLFSLSRFPVLPFLLYPLPYLQKDARVCAQLFCFDSASGYCVSYRPAAEGSPCGDGQVRVFLS